MKNQFEITQDMKDQAKLLFDLWCGLEGNAESFDPMTAGVKDVFIKSMVERPSRKGNMMLDIVLQSIKDGREVRIYVMKSRDEYNQWVRYKVGQQLKINLSFKDNFANVRVIDAGGVFDVLPKKPLEPTTIRTMFVFDLEVFKRDFLFVGTDMFTNERHIINNDLNAMRQFYLKYRDSLFIGYNSASYDNNVLRGYLQAKDPYILSKVIIESDDRDLVYNAYDTNKTPLFGLDLYHDNKLFSLKEHEAFLGLPIQETEVDFYLDRELTDKEKASNILYCCHDNDATAMRFYQNIGMLLAKVAIASMFDLDKKSILQTNANLTAQILGAKRTDVRDDLQNAFELPENIHVTTPEILDAYVGKEFELNEDGKLSVSLDYKDPQTGYEMTFGSGGVHGAIPSYIRVGRFLMRDFGSLYPNVNVNFDVLSRNIPPHLKDRFQGLLQKRLDAKYSGEKSTIINGVNVPTNVLINGYKLPLNTKFGATGAQFNKLYDPRNQFLCCVLGQLIMVDFYEKIRKKSTVIQSNTDCHAYIPNSEVDEREMDIELDALAERVGITLDKDEFNAIYQKDVNNYVAIDSNGKVKIKGAIGLTGGLKKSRVVVSNAFLNYLISGVPIEEYINQIDDVRSFQIISKTGWTYDRTIIRDANGIESKAQKVNRVFAIKDASKAVEIFKVKDNPEDGEDSYTKGIPNAPEFYAISNEACGEGIQLDEIDRQFYIDQTKELLEMWFGEDWEERIKQAHHEYKKQFGELPPKKEYIN